ncbi:hypothetical protein LTR36_004276 [Oleoguttula mirabilis]|uniref:F-box domain-containing protein n=1 Tax=Oleoguttula mirabilis TaxID=1507867 RepID=A0AAV9JGB7_9PEZI|nr:hypothetical protein LTR36_004276 [Oleoguttula mirabilis]
MSSLLELSHELLHCIFCEIEPADLSSLSKTCRALNSYVKGNRLLHKDLYMRRYDEPRIGHVEPDWEEEIQKLVQLEKILECEARDSKSAHLQFVAERINRLIVTASTDRGSSLNLRMLSEYFNDTTNIDAFLCASSLFARAGSEHQNQAPTPELRQASAKLHCLFGVPIDPIPSRSSFSRERPNPLLSPASCTRLQSRPLQTHTYARSKVYDLRQYNDGTLWGPFTDDGSQRADWEKVEAIMIVLGFNLNKFSERSDGRWPRVWHKPFVGATPGSYISLAPTIAEPTDKEGTAPTDDPAMLRIRELALSLDAQDPYGISGTWMRVVCFLDYNDLYAFNFSQRIPEDALRDPIDTEEAIRLIKIKLQVTKIEPPGSGDEDEYAEDGDESGSDGMDWSGFQGERLPVVHFRGNSRSLHASWDPNANSRIRGTVRQTPEGEIRWTTFSIFHGEERWRSEGIQVGGLRSARGVLGNWFDKDYDMHGPAGPTAFWKITDEMEDDKHGNTPLAYY